MKCVLALTKVLIPKDTPRKEYADIKTRPPEEGIVSLVGKISGGAMLREEALEETEAEVTR